MEFFQSKALKTINETQKSTKRHSLKIVNKIPFKYVLVLLLVLTFFSFGSRIKKETNVYICKGKSSKKYHYKKDCRGLSNCSTKTYEVTLTKAKEMGRTLCGWED
tara:strand:+ start:6029 stop:6343 length:315 start_codon:yes stop_codon:yes gene_type:complete